MLALLLAASLYGDPQLAFRFADPRITESSGIVAASTGDVLFTHNDSGDRARFYAVDGAGRTLTTYRVPGVAARDWEDIARGPDEQGRTCLWLGDIGDNNARRDNGVLLRRVREPVPGAATEVTTEPSVDFRLRYPDGPGDAETLLVHPRTGRVYVVSKPLGGPAKVYAAPARLDPAGPNQLELVGEVQAESTGTAGGPGIGSVAQQLFTAGDIAPDGTRVALRTYTDVYEWDVPGDDVAAAFDRPARVSPLPPTAQGEGLAYSSEGTALLTSSEGAGAPVHRLRPTGDPTAPSGPAAPSAQQDTAPAPDAAGPQDTAPVQSQQDWYVSTGLVAVLLGGAAAVPVALLLTWRRRRNRSGRR